MINPVSLLVASVLEEIPNYYPDYNEWSNEEVASMILVYDGLELVPFDEILRFVEIQRR